jgi:hypothetical protein
MSNTAFVADESVVFRTRFGRSRLLATLGGGLLAAAGLFVPEAARADPPAPCYGYDQCGCCNDGTYPGTHCCLSGCQYTGSLGCPGGSQCWLAC